MPIIFACLCGQNYSVEEQYAGQQTVCPRCQQLLTIPQLPSYAPTPPPPAQAPQPAFSRPTPSPRPKSAGLMLGLMIFMLFVLLLGGLSVALIVLDPEMLGLKTKEVASRSEPAPITPPENTKDKDKDKDKQPPPAPPVNPPQPPPPNPPAPTPRPALPPSPGPWQGHLAPILAAQLTPDGKILWTASGGREEVDGKMLPHRDSTLRQWDVFSGKELSRLVDFPLGIAVAVFSANGKYAAVVPSEDQKLIEIHDLAASRKQHTLKEHAGSVRSLSFSADGRYLLSGDEEGALILWDTVAGKKLRALRGHTAAVGSLAFSPDGLWAASGSADRSARLWEISSGESKRTITDLDAPVRAVLFTPDSRTVLTAGRVDHTIQMWDVRTGTEIKRFTGHERPVLTLALDRTANRLLSASEDGEVRYWEVQAGKLRGTFTGQTRPVRSLIFLGTDRRALAAGDHAQLRQLNLPQDLASLLQDLKSEDVAKRRSAIKGIDGLGDEARTVLPTLLDALTRKACPVRPDILTVVKKFAPLDTEHLDKLRTLLKDTSFAAGRLFALQTIASFKEKAKPAAKDLLLAAEDGDLQIRKIAILALVHIADSLESSAFKPLFKALNATEDEIRTAALSVLEKLPSPGVKEKSNLRALLSSKQRDAQRFAIRSLATLGTDAEDAAGELQTLAIRDSSEDVRLLALTALGKIAPKSNDTLKTCRTALDDKNIDVAREAARQIVTARDIQGVLQAVKHSDDDISRLAGEAIPKLRFDRSHVKAILTLLDSRSASTRQSGMEVLAKLGADADEAVSPLAKLLPRATTSEQKRILDTLTQLGAAAKEVSATVADLLKSKDREIRLSACDMLIRCKATEINKAIRVLIDELRPNKVEEIEAEDAVKQREKVRERLVTIGKPAVGSLLSALDGIYATGGAKTTSGILNGIARMEVLRTLGELGPIAFSSKAMLQLRDIERDDPFPGVKKAAREAKIRMQRKD